MIQLNLDILNTAQGRAAWNQTGKGCLVDRRRLGQNEIIGCFGLGQPGAGWLGERPD
jgi:hypothetical protein